jgi:hypothetical protein
MLNKGFEKILQSQEGYILVSRGPQSESATPSPRIESPYTRHLTKRKMQGNTRLVAPRQAYLGITSFPFAACALLVESQDVLDED